MVRWTASASDDLLEFAELLKGRKLSLESGRWLCNAPRVELEGQEITYVSGR